MNCTSAERAYLDAMRAMKTAWREYDARSAIEIVQPAGEPPLSRVDDAARRLGEASTALTEEWGL